MRVFAIVKGNANFSGRFRRAANAPPPPAGAETARAARLQKCGPPLDRRRFMQ
jgi:hypothetical protein